MDNPYLEVGLSFVESTIYAYIKPDVTIGASAYDPLRVHADTSRLLLNSNPIPESHKPENVYLQP